MNKSQLVLLTYLFVICFAQFGYYRSSGDANTRSSFLLPNLDSGTIVTAYIDLYGNTYSYNLELWKPYSYPPNAPDQRTVLTGTSQYVSSAVGILGNWRLVVTPLTTSTPQFQFNIIIYANSTVIGKYTDIARYNRVLVLYHNSAGNHNVTVDFPSSLDGQSTLYLYGPFQTLTVTGGQEIINTSQQKIMTINYQTVGKLYYYIELVQTDQMTAASQLISIKYESDQYQCPYDQAFADSNGVFTGCSNSLPTKGYPCVIYDNSLNTCTACANKWTLTAQGACMQNTSCPKGQYYRFGNCYDAISNCINFQPIGGLCISCKSGYKLQNYNNGSQFCEQNQITCQSNQYLLGSICMNYVSNCSNFQLSSGQCLGCQFGFTLSQNKCNQDPVLQSASCSLGYKPVNRECTPIDSNCIFYYINNTCMVCQRGYIINGICQKIICGPRQYSGSGLCVDVSPLCNTFDPVYGTCLTCIIFYYLQSDGSCLQSLPSHAGAQDSAKCPDNYYMRQGTCVQINPLCKTYDTKTGACTTCLDNTYYLTPAGVCVLISQLCGFRTYFANGNCLPVSALCDTYDSTTGFCLACKDNTKLTATGACMYSMTCGSRQYYQPDGSCANVSETCGDYNVDNGTCITCAPSFQLNEGGVCCIATNYMFEKYKNACLVFYKSNCVTQHPVFSYCLKCATGYTLTYVPFGRCNSISPAGP